MELSKRMEEIGQIILFINNVLTIKKKNGVKPEIDIGFVFNDYEKFWMSKIIKGNFYSLGSTINNYYIKKKKITHYYL